MIVPIPLFVPLYGLGLLLQLEIISVTCAPPYVSLSQASCLTPTSTDLPQAMGLTPALSKLVGPGPMARTQTVKKLWEYIKTNDLQCPTDRRVIVSDSKMMEVRHSSNYGARSIAATSRTRATAPRGEHQATKSTILRHQ